MRKWLDKVKEIAERFKAESFTITLGVPFGVSASFAWKPEAAPLLHPADEPRGQQESGATLCPLRITLAVCEISFRALAEHS